MKEFLSSRGVEIQDRDVTVDREAAAEMIRISQQRGVPVVVLDGQVVVGFNRPQLERILSGLGRPRLGASVADAATIAAQGHTSQTMGAYVGKVTPGGAADHSGVHAGDVIVGFAGRPVSSATHLQQLLAGLSRGQNVPVELVRDGQRIKIVLVFG